MALKYFARLGLLAVACAAFVSTASAQTAAGAIKAVRIEGNVRIVAPNGTEKAATEGAALTEKDTIVTDAGSSVVLVFMNGSSVKLAANSKLAIDEFRMDPLGEDIKVAELKDEPAVSKTALNLAYGEMVGNVKKLRTGSTYNVKTPVGGAGIRGTTFRIVLTPAPDGKTFNFQLSTAEGVVVFSGNVPAGEAAHEVAVAANQEVKATAEVDTTTNAISNVQVTSAQTISQEAVRQITEAVTQAITQAQESTTFTTTEQRDAASSTSPQSSSSSEQQQSENQQQQQKNQTEESTPRSNTSSGTSGNTTPSNPVDPTISASTSS